MTAIAETMRVGFKVAAAREGSKTEVVRPEVLASDSDGDWSITECPWCSQRIATLRRGFDFVAQHHSCHPATPR